MTIIAGEQVLAISQMLLIDKRYKKRYCCTVKITLFRRIKAPMFVRLIFMNAVAESSDILECGRGGRNLIFRKAVALCFLLLCLPLMSCAGKKAITTGAITGDDLNSGDNISFESAYAKYSPSDIVLTSSGGEHHVTWDLMYYFICLAIEEVYGTTGAYPDLGDTSETGYHSQIMARAEESALACLAIEYAAAEIGAEITGDDRASIALNQELAEEQEGGSEAFEEYLSAIHASRDVYLYLTGIIDYLYENTVIATYGEGARL